MEEQCVLCPVRTKYTYLYIMSIILALEGLRRNNFVYVLNLFDICAFYMLCFAIGVVVGRQQGRNMAC